MRKSRKVETADQRQDRLETKAQQRARADSEEQTIDEMVRRSIQLFGA